jgi:hypothetical protein
VDIRIGIRSYSPSVLRMSSTTLVPCSDVRIDLPVSRERLLGQCGWHGSGYILEDSTGVVSVPAGIIIVSEEIVLC